MVRQDYGRVVGRMTSQSSTSVVKEIEAEISRLNSGQVTAEEIEQGIVSLADRENCILGMRQVARILKRRDAEQRREMKELAHRLLTEVEGRIATVEVRRDGANSNEISVEESLKHLQFVRKRLEALASTKSEVKE